MHYVYIIKSKKNSRLYTGYSSNLKQRVADHNSGKSAYTRNLRPWVLVYYEAYLSKLDAQHREKSLKLRSNANMQLRKRIKILSTKVKWCDMANGLVIHRNVPKSRE